MQWGQIQPPEGGLWAAGGAESNPEAQHDQRQGSARGTCSAPGCGHLCWEGLGFKGRLREQDLLGRRRLWKEPVESQNS